VPAQHVVDGQGLGHHHSVRALGRPAPAPDSAVRGEASLDVASAGSAGETDLYEITASDTQEAACLAVSAGEPPPGEFLGSVNVSTSVTSGPC